MIAIFSSGLTSLHLSGTRHSRRTPRDSGRTVSLRRCAVLACIAAFVAAGMGGASVAEAKSCKKIKEPYRIGHPFGPIQSLNPVVSFAAADTLVLDRIYEPLVRLRPAVDEPALAASWVSEATDAGGQLITFSLTDAKWHDSKKVRADDVAFSLFLAREITNASPGNLSAGVNSITDIEITQKDEVKVHSTDASYFAFRDIASAIVLPEHIWAVFESIDDVVAFDNATPVGSGPFRYRSDMSTPDTQYLQRFSNYWGGCSNIEQIQLSSDSGSLSPVQQISADILDLWVAPGVSQAFVDEASINPSVGSRLAGQLGFRYLAFNFRRPQTADPAFRQAIAHLVDRAGIIAALGITDIVEPLGQLVSEDFGPWRNPASTADYDPQLARQLLENADYFNESGDYVGSPIGILVPEEDPVRVAFTEAIASEAQAIGLPILVEAVSIIDVVERVFPLDPPGGDPDFDIYVLGWGLAPDVRYLADFFRSDSSFNTTGIDVNSLDIALDAMLDATDRADAIAAAHAAQAILAAELPYLVLYRSNDQSYFDVAFQGYQVPNGESTLLNNGTLLNLDSN